MSNFFDSIILCLGGLIESLIYSLEDLFYEIRGEQYGKVFKNI